MGLLTFGCLDFWMFGLLDVWTFGCLDVWTFGRLNEIIKFCTLQNLL
jgi:hypothetical protein